MEEKDIIASSRIAQLISGYLFNELSPAEVSELEQWLDAGEGNKAVFTEVLDDASLTESGALYKRIDIQSSLQATKARLSFTEAKTNASVHQLRTWLASAAAVAAITLGVWLYYTSSRFNSSADTIPSSQTKDRYTNIAPGKNTATLTLANGKTFSLDTSRASVVVTDSVKAMTMLTASTPRGGTYQVVLPDGTKVWLNADSKISFPSQFNGTERKIILEGEAYFEVFKDAAHPFIVQTEKQQIEVLGTHFNVNSYSDEPNTKTTLLEGSVKVTTKTNSGILAPGEQAVLADQQLNIKKVNITDVVAWKNGVFAYKDAPLDVVLRQLSRWYDVDIVYANEQAKEQTFTGTVSRYDQVKELLNAIEYVGDVKFKIEGRKIIVN